MDETLKLIVNYKGKHRIMYVRDYNELEAKGENITVLAKEYTKKYDEYIELMKH